MMKKETFEGFKAKLQEKYGDDLWEEEHDEKEKKVITFWSHGYRGVDGSWGEVIVGRYLVKR